MKRPNRRWSPVGFLVIDWGVRMKKRKAMGFGFQVLGVVSFLSFMLYIFLEASAASV